MTIEEIKQQCEAMAVADATVKPDEVITGSTEALQYAGATMAFSPKAARALLVAIERISIQSDASSDQTIRKIERLFSQP